MSSENHDPFGDILQEICHSWWNKLLNAEKCQCPQCIGMLHEANQKVNWFETYTISTTDQPNIWPWERLFRRKSSRIVRREG